MPDLTNERAKLSGEMDIGMDSEFFVDLSDAELAGFLNGLDDDAVKVLDMAEVDGCVQQVVNYSVAQGLFHKHSSPAALLEGDEECRGSEPWTCSSSSDDDDDDSDEGKTGGFSVDPIYTMSCSGNESDGTVVEPICGWSDDGCPSKLGFDAPCFSEEMGGDFSLKRLDSADSAETDVGTTYSCTIDDESELYYYVGCDSGTEVYEVDIRSATKKPLCSVEDAVGWQGTSKKGKKGKKGKKPEARKVITKKDSITPDVLRTKFHLSRRQAATELGRYLANCSVGLDILRVMLLTTMMPCRYRIDLSEKTLPKPRNCTVNHICMPS